MLRTELPVYLTLLAALVAACGDDSAPAHESDTSSDGLGADAASDGSLDVVEVATCDEVEPTTAVRGSVVDEAGSALTGVKAQVCLRLEVSDRLICLSPSDTDATGAFEVNVPPSAQCASEATIRVLAPGANRATIYCEVGLEGSGTEVDTAQPYILPATAAATVLPEYGDAAVMRTVEFEGGLEVDVIPDQLSSGEADYVALAGALIDPAEVDVCFAGETHPFALWAFSPEMNVDAAAFGARFPNTGGLEAGAAVDLYVLGGLYTTATSRDPLREGAWVKFATATVSADGTTIDAPRGVPATTWIGLVAQ